MHSQLQPATSAALDGGRSSASHATHLECKYYAIDSVVGCGAPSITQASLMFRFVLHRYYAFNSVEGTKYYTSISVVQNSYYFAEAPHHFRHRPHVYIIYSSACGDSYPSVGGALSGVLVGPPAAVALQSPGA